MSLFSSRLSAGRIGSFDTGNLDSPVMKELMTSMSEKADDNVDYTILGNRNRALGACLSEHHAPCLLKELALRTDLDSFINTTLGRAIEKREVNERLAVRFGHASIALYIAGWNLALVGRLYGENEVTDCD